MKEVLGDEADSSDADGPEWSEYEPLSEAEMKEVLGEDPPSEPEEDEDDNDSEQDD